MARLYSMTGYGEGRAESERLRVAVSIRTVNHRFLDLQMRLPDGYRGFEIELATAIKRALRRGRVEARYRVDPLVDPALEVRVRREVAASYRRAASELDETPAEGAAALTAAELLTLPEVVVVESAESEPGEAEAELLRAATGRALEAVLESRAREGEHLTRALGAQIARLRTLRDELAASAGDIQRALAEGLEQRLVELVGDRGIEPERLAQEAAILADRSDVREELDRLAAHLDALEQGLAGAGERGKKMDFVTQEVLRELNTLGAKCRNSGQLERVIEAKTVCEQLREQVQNIE